MALFPKKSDVPTYKYNPVQVFYHCPKYIGLSEQFFPHIDLDQDFLSSLMSGGNIDRFLREQGDAVEGAAERFNSTFEAVRNLIRDNFLVERHPGPFMPSPPVMPAITITVTRPISPCWLSWDLILIASRSNGHASSRRKASFHTPSSSITVACWRPAMSMASSRW